jgi:SWI/SNF-related matrix-associated actin-dependent regulator of chromatin subfamily A-like protein 1
MPPSRRWLPMPGSPALSPHRPPPTKAPPGLVPWHQQRSSWQARAAQGIIGRPAKNARFKLVPAHVPLMGIDLKEKPKKAAQVVIQRELLAHMKNAPLFVEPQSDTADEIIEQLRSAKSRSIGPFAAPFWFDSKAKIQRRLGDFRAKGEKFPDYQVEGMYYLASRKGALLADDMGLGKTIQALMAIPDATKCGVMVIAPAGLQRNWLREILKWRPDFKVFELSKSNFRWPWLGHIVIAKWESLPELSKIPPKPSIKMLGVVDEAHRGKNPSAKRTRASREILSRCDATWLLTGTAMANKPKDFFEVLTLAGLQKYAGARLKVYTSSFFEFNSKGKCTKADPRAAKLRQLICLRRTKSEVAKEIPPKSYARLWVEVSKPALSRTMKKLITKFGGESALLAKLTTEGMAASERAHTYEVMGRIRREIAIAKLPHVLSWIRDREEEDEPVVVTCCHREPVLQLSERKGWGKIIGGMTSAQKEKTVVAFQAGKLKGLAISTAGSEGITLTRACKMLRIDKDYLPKTNLQWEDRICRYGQERRTTITDVWAGDVEIDGLVDAICQRKLTFMKAADLI